MVSSMDYVTRSVKPKTMTCRNVSDDFDEFAVKVACPAPRHHDFSYFCSTLDALGAHCPQCGKMMNIVATSRDRC